MFIAVCLLCGAQQTKSDTLKTKEVVQTEKVEGLWGVLGYYGGKLASELGNRLNLESSKEDEVPTKVLVQFGWLNYSRLENRPKK
ncbi:MAG: hypothetical protein NWR73_04575 [Flavobacteriales bacterium]|nr:hypothetical protein [Flavobacteriales bacterium]